MRGDKIADWFILLLYVAIIFLMVRPRSQGPKLLEGFFNGTRNLITAVTGGGRF